MSITISGIGQICLSVSSIEKALPFYVDILGGQVIAIPAPHLAFVRFGDIRVMLAGQTGTQQPPSNSLVYFQTQDIQRTFDEIVEKGGFPERNPEKVADMEDYALWMAFLRDPDGSIVGLMEEKR